MEGKAKFVLYISVQMLSLFTDRQTETHKDWIACQEKTEKCNSRSGERLWICCLPIVSSSKQQYLPLINNSFLSVWKQLSNKHITIKDVLLASFWAWRMWFNTPFWHWESLYMAKGSCAWPSRVIKGEQLIYYFCYRSCWQPYKMGIA